MSLADPGEGTPPLASFQTADIDKIGHPDFDEDPESIASDHLQDEKKAQLCAAHEIVPLEVNLLWPEKPVEILEDEEGGENDDYRAGPGSYVRRVWNLGHFSSWFRLSAVSRFDSCTNPMKPLLDVVSGDFSTGTFCLGRMEVVPFCPVGEGFEANVALGYYGTR